MIGETVESQLLYAQTAELSRSPQKDKKKGRKSQIFICPPFNINIKLLDHKRPLISSYPAV